MRTAPDMTDAGDIRDVEKLNAKPWQLDLLKKNPDYVFWGNYEDYMIKKDGWDSAIELETFAERFTLDELNELVNFYFQVYRTNHECPHCDGSGYNPETKQLYDDWYGFGDPSRRWVNKLTEVEVEALVRRGRLTDLTDQWYRFNEETGEWNAHIGGVWTVCEAPKMPTPEEVNEWSMKRPGLGHDAINHSICVKARARHLGVYGYCEHCNDGVIYDDNEAKVGLQLWILHPRKGCSRGVYIKNIEEDEVPAVLEYLRSAARRNAERFSRL